jgi:hypothetical protein
VTLDGEAGRAGEEVSRVSETDAESDADPPPPQGAGSASTESREPIPPKRAFLSWDEAEREGPRAASLLDAR